MDRIKQCRDLLKILIDKEFDGLNPQQREAALTVNGPLLILAGAGSGKTTVLINRIAYMIKYGDLFYSDPPGYDCTEELLNGLKNCVLDQKIDEEVLYKINKRAVKPYHILAITFTNKAANELKNRIAASVGEAARDVMAATFHSVCSRILRREIEVLGYQSNFTIYDADDSIRVIRDCLNTLNVSDKMFAPKMVLGMISSAKDKLIDPESYRLSAGKEYRLSTIAQIYAEYQKRLKVANALDFDDIIVQTVDLFQKHPDVLEKYQDRYRYIMVDEYQDTNHAQYRFISLLSKKRGNLCVVGDDDQSIYKFRGANIENILQFENQYPETKVIKLEQNYRSTGNILDAANALIANNTSRKGKKLWTQKEQGPVITLYGAVDESDEAEFVADQIEEHIKNGEKYSDHAVLYRMNAQSNSIERYFTRSGIPYRIVGGLRFFERREIKDIVAYLSVINNPDDAVRLSRIINEPKRGIGDSTLATVKEIASVIGIGTFEVMKNADQYEALSRRSEKLAGFVSLIESLREESENRPLGELIELILDRSGYRTMMESLGEEGRMRLENIAELISNTVLYEEENPEPTLSGFLEEISLYTDLDSYNENEDSVILMTLHSAKGLEFKRVFIIGVEEGIFPGRMSLSSLEELEEERRLAYVGVTRAKEELFLTCTQQRLLFGQTARNKRSRFVDELPLSLLREMGTKRTPFLGAAVREGSRQAEVSADQIGISAKKKSVKADFSVGDTVAHNIFGNGLVLSMVPMGGDTLVEIAFDKVGTKKIMLNYAKLKKIT